MRKLFVSMIAAFLAVSAFAQDAQKTTETAATSDTAKKFYIYKDKEATENHYIPSGWMGDVNDLKINGQSTEAVASGTTSIQITYTAKKSQGNGWAGVYWQSTQGNWGMQKTGFDLSDFNKLVFKAKGKVGGEVITSVKVGGLTTINNQPAAYPDTANVEYGPIKLTSDWQEFSVNIEGKDLSYINGGLAIIFNADQAGGNEQTIYIDDVYFTKDPSLTKSAPTTNFPFYVYADNGSLDNHFIPSGWMPPAAARDIKVNGNWTEAPYSGASCIRVEYKSTGGWAGIYWQQPANNWGTVPNAGFNLQGATKLTFWAKGETGTEMINEFKMGGMSAGEYPDSDSASIMSIQLTKEWKKYEIDLRGRDLSHVIGGFGWAANIDSNPQGVVFYLDDIRYEKD
jgi:hypothetical protein